MRTDHPTAPLPPLALRRYRRPAMRSMRRAVLRSVVWCASGQGLWSKTASTPVAHACTTEVCPADFVA